MKLSNLLDGVPLKAFQGHMDVEITGLTKDSREVEPGSLFFATKASTPFIDEALRRGAVAAVSEGACLEGFHAAVSVEDLRGLMGPVSARFYNYPSRNMSMIAITGTNGKTTTSYIIESILRAAERKVGVIGTISYRFNGHEMAAQNTTPGATEIQRLLSAMSRNGTDSVVMEVSSHALDQGRVDGVEFDTAILTNVTHDHLDYHRTFDNYKAAKVSLFTRYLMESRKGTKYAILNMDDPNVSDFVPGEPVQAVYYSLFARGDAYVMHSQEDLSGLQLEISVMERRFEISSPLVGAINAHNLLAGALFAVVKGLPLEAIQRGCAAMKGVPGRLQRVGGASDPAVFVDYAHTPDALKKVLEILRRLKRKGRLIVVFGCGGDRDRAKRPLMGRIASDLADFAVVTSDNPRTERAGAIIDEIKSGLKGSAHSIEEDRREAIFKAIAMAEAGDIVLVAGKGHENYQIIGSTSIHFSDREVAEEALGVVRR